MLRQGVRRDVLGRPRTAAAERARETDRLSLAAMFFLAALCLVAGVLPGFFIDALAPAVQSIAGDRMPIQRGLDWLSIVPIAESRSSYNGLLVFGFMLVSGTLAAFAIHRLASDRLRRAPAWDCGYPDSDRATQYSASSFAQPIRRVFGTLVFRAREHVDMPAPGQTRPARLTVELRDPIWDALYAPIAVAVGFAADRLDHLQFLTIRQFLSLVFAALVLPAGAGDMAFTIGDVAGSFRFAAMTTGRLLLLTEHADDLSRWRRQCAALRIVLRLAPDGTERRRCRCCWRYAYARAHAFRGRWRHSSWMRKRGPRWR